MITYVSLQTQLLPLLLFLAGHVYGCSLPAWGPCGSTTGNYTSREANTQWQPHGHTHTHTQTHPQWLYASLTCCLIASQELVIILGKTTQALCECVWTFMFVFNSQPQGWGGGGGYRHIKKGALNGTEVRGKNGSLYHSTQKYNFRPIHEKWYFLSQPLIFATLTIIFDSLSEIIGYHCFVCALFLVLGYFRQLVMSSIMRIQKSSSTLSYINVG